VRVRLSRLRTAPSRPDGPVNVCAIIVQDVACTHVIVADSRVLLSTCALLTDWVRRSIGTVGVREERDCVQYCTMQGHPGTRCPAFEALYTEVLYCDVH